MKDVYLHSTVRYNGDRTTATAVVPCINPTSVHRHIFLLKRSHSQPKNHGAIVASPCHHVA
ncbi:hypothetical protein GIB67_016788 [Kingdonia uniflora]|uniref:Uncharacterized protein n=1 Tax=Kingdonia uniflora TaxID=39325 RepID=A0A7J7LXP8_9MAGN|nr:hypothetical protein GIB67_016788 [Kingdonia uniflora]